MKQLLFCVAIFWSAVLQAQRLHSLSLFAVKNGSSYEFRTGYAVKIIADNGNGKEKVKGYVTAVLPNAIEITSFSDRFSNQTTVAISAIQKITRISRKGRQLDVKLIAGGLLYAGAMYAIIGKPTALSYLLFIPAIGAGLFVAYHLPVSFLIDLLREKKASKGWRFVVK